MKKYLTALCLLWAVFAKAQTKDVQLFALNNLPAKEINDKITRRTLSGAQATIGYFTFKKGAVVPLHQHDNEQYSFILKGSVKVTIGPKEYIVKAGEGILIPAKVSHRFEALEEETLDLDFFSPPRLDWINGTDNYFITPKN